MIQLFRDLARLDQLRRSERQLAEIKALMLRQNEVAIEAHLKGKSADYNSLWVDLWVAVAPAERD